MRRATLNDVLILLGVAAGLALLAAANPLIAAAALAFLVALVAYMRG